jgi:hypothetical protein
VRLIITFDIHDLSVLDADHDAASRSTETADAFVPAIDGDDGLAFP